MVMMNLPEQSPKHDLDIPWEMMEGMLSGVSAIDTPEMNVRSLADAEAFIRCYGYDPQRAEDMEELQHIRNEALAFLQRSFLDPTVDWTALDQPELSQPMPPMILDAGCDARQLLVLASTGPSVAQRWACALLKVMHTLCHISNAVLYRHFEEARTQILSRYYHVLSNTAVGDILLGSPDDLALTLAGFEIKDEKSRDSMLIKLLCKRENVAEELFDMIGVRLITHTPAEAVVALEILRRHQIIIYPNIIPSRSRNSLLNVQDFRQQYEDALDPYHCGAASFTETLSFIEQMPVTLPQTRFNPDNAHTNAAYHAIHLTERQLIRFKHPGSREETRFFFPYEIQVVDAASAAENKEGSSAHSQYKLNQLIQARRRVLGTLLLPPRKNRLPELDGQ